MKTAAEIQLQDQRLGRPSAGRSPHWSAVRHAHLQKQPTCQWCGGTKSVEVHHKQPFHLHPELELDESNLITLCEETAGLECHLKHGHLGNWHNFNIGIQVQCDTRRRMGLTGA